MENWKFGTDPGKTEEREFHFYSGVLWTACVFDALYTYVWCVFQLNLISGFKFEGIVLDFGDGKDLKERDAAGSETPSPRCQTLVAGSLTCQPQC